MSTQLNELLDEIDRQKQEYIVPDNLKKDVTVFGVEGNIPDNARVYDSVDDMKEYTKANINDVATVLNKNYNPIQQNSIFDKCYFPKTVVLDAAILDSVFATFEPVNESHGNIDAYLYESGFSFNYMEQNISVNYTSSDGITYTRTDSEDDIVNLGAFIKPSTQDEFPSVIGNFMMLKDYSVNSIYEFQNNIKDYIVEGRDITNWTTLGLLDDNTDAVVAYYDVSDMLDVYNRAIDQSATKIFITKTTSYVINNITVYKPVDYIFSNMVTSSGAPFNTSFYNDENKSYVALHGEFGRTTNGYLDLEYYKDNALYKSVHLTDNNATETKDGVTTTIDDITEYFTYLGTVEKSSTTVLFTITDDNIIGMLNASSIFEGEMYSNEIDRGWQFASYSKNIRDGKFNVNEYVRILNKGDNYESVLKLSEEILYGESVDYGKKLPTDVSYQDTEIGLKLRQKRNSANVELTLNNNNQSDTLICSNVGVTLHSNESEDINVKYNEDVELEPNTEKEVIVNVPNLKVNKVTDFDIVDDYSYTVKKEPSQLDSEQDVIEALRPFFDRTTYWQTVQDNTMVDISNVTLNTNAEQVLNARQDMFNNININEFTPSKNSTVLLEIVFFDGSDSNSSNEVYDSSRSIRYRVYKNNTDIYETIGIANLNERAYIDGYEEVIFKYSTGKWYWQHFQIDYDEDGEEIYDTIQTEITSEQIDIINNMYSDFVPTHYAVCCNSLTENTNEKLAYVIKYLETAFNCDIKLKDGVNPYDVDYTTARVNVELDDAVIDVTRASVGFYINNGNYGSEYTYYTRMDGNTFVFDRVLYGQYHLYATYSKYRTVTKQITVNSKDEISESLILTKNRHTIYLKFIDDSGNYLNPYYSDVHLKNHGESSIAYVCNRFENNEYVFENVLDNSYRLEFTLNGVSYIGTQGVYAYSDDYRQELVVKQGTL